MRSIKRQTFVSRKLHCNSGFLKSIRIEAGIVTDYSAAWEAKCKKFTRDCTEPDAEGYDCPKCGGKTVMGAENALMTFTIDIK